MTNKTPEVQNANQAAVSLAKALEPLIVERVSEVIQQAQKQAAANASVHLLEDARSLLSEVEAFDTDSLVDSVEVDASIYSVDADVGYGGDDITLSVSIDTDEKTLDVSDLDSLLSAVADVLGRLTQD